MVRVVNQRPAIGARPARHFVRARRVARMADADGLSAGGVAPVTHSPWTTAGTLLAAGFADARTMHGERR